MKKIGLIFAILFFFAGAAYATEYKFKVANKTGFEIIDLYFSPATQGDWGEEVLTVDTIPDKDAIEVQFSRKEKAESWDIKVADENGVTYKWNRIKLMNHKTLVLSIKGGQPVAMVQ
jgi:hypothetical protein